MSTPGWEAIVEQQRNEILIRDIEAQQQAAMEAQQQGLENPQAPPAEQPVQEPAPPAPEAQPEVTPQPPEETPAYMRRQQWAMLSGAQRNVNLTRKRDGRIR